MSCIVEVDLYKRAKQQNIQNYITNTLSLTTYFPIEIASKIVLYIEKDIEMLFFQNSFFCDEILYLFYKEARDRFVFTENTKAAIRSILRENEHQKICGISSKKQPWEDKFNKLLNDDRDYIDNFLKLTSFERIWITKKMVASRKSSVFLCKTFDSFLRL